MPINQAKVKSVLSGDTLVLTAVNNPNQERTLSLAFVSAPRMRREGDEVGIYCLLAAIGDPTALYLLKVVSLLLIGTIIAFCIPVEGLPA